MSRNSALFTGILSGLFLVSCTSQPGKPAVKSDDNLSSVSSASSSRSSALPVSSSSSSSVPSSVPQVSSLPSSPSSPQASFSRKTYYDAKTGFTFWHPARMTVTAPKSFYLEAGEVGYEINDPSHHGEIWVSVKLDATKKSKGPITKKDIYAAPGGNLSRDYVLYTGKYRVSVNAHYDVFPPFYEGKYKPSDGFSISELVERDLGGDLKNPIQRLIAVYPSDKTLKQFYDDADAIVNSMETE